MTDLIGKSIGEYQLLELIGEDEHTVQVKAFQPGKNRYVNFTTPKPSAAKNGFFLQQFLNAAEIASKLDHPNVLPVLDYGQQEGIVYRVSPMSESGTISEQRGWFYELQNTNLLLSQIIDGLAHIYTRGHIHGNLKSSNVYLNADLQPMLAGFGIAQPAGWAENPYLSPEQIKGGVIDQRSDVYALGVLLYELLVGVTPPVGILAKPSSMRQDLPQAIDQIVFKAMAQSPDQRFESPAEFRIALQNALKNPTSANTADVPPPTPAGMSQSVNVQQAKSTNWTAIILGVVLIVVLIGGAILVIPRLFGDDGAAVLPDEPPVIQPNEPPAEQPPGGEPGDPPANSPNRPDLQLPEGLPEFCYSIVGAAGIAVFGITAFVNKNKRDTYYDE